MEDVINRDLAEVSVTTSKQTPLKAWHDDNHKSSGLCDDVALPDQKNIERNKEEVV